MIVSDEMDLDINHLISEVTDIEFDRLFLREEPRTFSLNLAEEKRIWKDNHIDYSENAVQLNVLRCDSQKR